MRAITLAAKVDPLGGAVSRRTGAKVMQNNTGRTEWHVPVIGLMQVIVQSNNGTGLAVAAIALNHFASLRKPFATIGLNEKASFVAMNLGVDDVDTCNEI
jgi:hypothetical protein